VNVVFHGWVAQHYPVHAAQWQLRDNRNAALLCHSAHVLSNGEYKKGKGSTERERMPLKSLVPQLGPYGRIFRLQLANMVGHFASV
jgi:hypothetical protein